MLTLLVIADTHVGSEVGVFPAGFTSHTGNRVRLNKAQRYLWRCWKDAEGRLPGKLDVVVFNGDLTHGKNPKESSRFLTEPDPQWQARAAEVLLRPIRDRAEVAYACLGTEYHGGEAGEWEESLCERLGVIPGPDGHFARLWLGLDMEGVKIGVAHGQSPMIRYPSSAGAREIQFEKMVADMKVGGDSHLIVRSHTHTYWELFAEGTQYLSTLAFTLADRYVRGKNVSKNRYLQRWVGMMLVRVYPERVGSHLKVVEVEPVWYSHPKWRREKYERGSG